MSCLTYPKITEYKLPEKNVLVISCIDLRLTDNLLHFLHFDNLANRFDHVTLAGASLGYLANKEHKRYFKEDVLKTYDFKAWKTTLDNHLKIAIDLHSIKDVYIVEHMDCGAYKYFLDHTKLPDAVKNDEVALHKLFADALALAINAPEYPQPDAKGYIEKDKHGKEIDQHHLNVHCFLIDLRGNVTCLSTTNPAEHAAEGELPDAIGIQNKDNH